MEEADRSPRPRVGCGVGVLLGKQRPVRGAAGAEELAQWVLTPWVLLGCQVPRTGGCEL